MAKNIYPRFERYRIMKKELLWALRDYSYGFMRLEYEKYGDGILEGLDISVGKNEIRIGTGIVKYKDSVILFAKEETVPFEATERYGSLKLRMNKDEKASEDYVLLEAAPFIDEKMERKENEFEVCRFKLKQGARLRHSYVGFFDMETEFDTVNLAEATWAAIGGQSLCPRITEYFAAQALQCELKDPRDSFFCHLALSSTKAMRRELIEDYVQAKLELAKEPLTNRQLFAHLEMILRNLQNGTELRPARQHKKMRQIIVD